MTMNPPESLLCLRTRMASSIERKGSPGGASSQNGKSDVLNRVWLRWLNAHFSIDLGISAALVGILFASARWFLPPVSGWFPPLGGYAEWNSFVGGLMGVASTLVGFGLTAITIALTIGSGERGRRVVLRAGVSLRQVLTRSMSAAICCLGGLAILSALDPRLSQAVPLALIFVVVVLTLSVLRLYALLASLVMLALRDTNGS